MFAAQILLLVDLGLPCALLLSAMLCLQPAERNMAMQYRIRVKYHLDTSSQLSFASLELTYEAEGTTLLAGDLVDQASLIACMNVAGIVWPAGLAAGSKGDW